MLDDPCFRRNPDGPSSPRFTRDRRPAHRRGARVLPRLRSRRDRAGPLRDRRWRRAAPDRRARAPEATEPITRVRVRLEVQPRLVQKSPALLALNAPGRTDRWNARSPAALGAAPP